MAETYLEKRTIIHVSKEERDRLKILAVKRKISMRALIRAWIEMAEAGHE